jgi:hypothetical protein
MTTAAIPVASLVRTLRQCHTNCPSNQSSS